MACGDRSTGTAHTGDEIGGIGRSVSSHVKARNTPLWRRTNTLGPPRQKMRFARPDCPQQQLRSEVIVTVHPQNATYGAVCSVLKGHDVGV